MGWRDGDPDWLAQARCAGMDVNIFYPEPGSRRDDPSANNAWKRGLRTCALCPVRRDCLEDALSYEEARWDPTTRKWLRKLPQGVWGGRRPKERHSARLIHYATQMAPGPKGGPPRRICAKGPACKGCRPIEERVALLEEDFINHVHSRGLLTDREDVVA